MKCDSGLTPPLHGRLLGVTALRQIRNGHIKREHKRFDTNDHSVIIYSRPRIVPTPFDVLCSDEHKRRRLKDVRAALLQSRALNKLFHYSASLLNLNELFPLITSTAPSN